MVFARGGRKNRPIIAWSGSETLLHFPIVFANVRNCITNVLPFDSIDQEFKSILVENHRRPFMTCFYLFAVLRHLKIITLFMFECKARRHFGFNSSYSISHHNIVITEFSNFLLGSQQCGNEYTCKCTCKFTIKVS